MTLDDFRADGALVSQWREVLNMPITKLVLGIMQQQSPVHRIIKTDISPTFASVRLGHQAGWAEYEKTFTEVVLIPPQKSQEIEATYEKPADQEEQ